MFIENIIHEAKQESLREGVLYVHVKVIPNAPKTELVEKMMDPEGEEVWKIKVAAPPVKGKANAELCRYLSTIFQVPRSSVVLIAGAASRRKLLRIMNNG